MIRAVLALLLLVWAAPAAARDAALACVQAQLRALGHDAGPADGIWGARTEAGGRSFAASVGVLSGLPELTPYNASVLCRQLGLREAALRRYWPVSGGATLQLTTRGLAPGSEAELRAMSGLMLERYQKRFGLDMAEPVAVVVGQSRADLEVLWQKQLGNRFSASGFDTIYKQSCGGAGQIGGFASGAVVAVCLPDGSLPSDAQRLWLLQTTLAHEVFHAVQRLLVGHPRPELAARTVGYAGPEWLIEGSAIYLSLRVTLPDALMELSYANLAARVRNRADLAALESYMARQHMRTALYDHGAYAAYLLTRADGGRSLIQFYELVGLGQSWPDAFALAFGVPLHQFYADYKAGTDQEGRR